MHDTQDYVDALSIKPNCIALYEIPLFDFTRHKFEQGDNIKQSKSLSRLQAKRLRSYFNWLFVLSKSKRVYSKDKKSYFSFKVNFITLTLSKQQVHTDQIILKQLFEPFIRTLRDKYPELIYIWKAESQDNGNIHFHLNTNVFINFLDLRYLWNKQQAKLNYVNKDNIMKPNSTDISAVKNAKELGAYMAKYISKGDLYTRPLKRYHKMHDSKLLKKKDSCNIPKNYFKLLKRKVNIKLFDCSKTLKAIRINQIGYSTEISLEITYLYNTNKLIIEDYFTLILTNNIYHSNTPNLNKFISKKLREYRNKTEGEKKSYTKTELIHIPKKVLPQVEQLGINY